MNELWHGKYYHRAYMETRERPVCLWESGSCCQRRLSLCLSSLKKEREVASFSNYDMVFKEKCVFKSN